VRRSEDKQEDEEVGQSEYEIHAEDEYKQALPADCRVLTPDP
jgi:hypothetical protein